MPSPERREPEQAPLPPELAEFLKDRRFACVTQATNKGTVLVIKAPGREIESVRGRVPVHLRYYLYQHPAAPVIRMILTIYDQPKTPLAFETFINVEDTAQRSDFEALANQRELDLLFYDEELAHRLGKRVHIGLPKVVRQILSAADRLLAAIPKERFDFDRAKAEVMGATTL